MVKKLESRIDILGSFLPEINKERTIKQIMKKIKLSYQPTYKYLIELEKEGMLLHKKEGNTHFYRLSLENDEVRKHIETMEVKRRKKFLEKSEFKELIEILVERLSNNLYPYLSSVLLFGSVARGKYAKKSDIDIFIIVSSNDERKIKELMKEAENVSTSVGYEFNRAVSPITVSITEFRNMIRRKEEFVKNLLNEGLVLYGESVFYGEIIKSMRELKWID